MHTLGLVFFLIFVSVIAMTSNLKSGRLISVLRSSSICFSMEPMLVWKIENLLGSVFRLYEQMSMYLQLIRKASSSDVSCLFKGSFSNGFVLLIHFHYKYL